MSFLSWLIFGVVLGSISFLIDQEHSLSNFLQTLMLSILGAILGGTLAHLVIGVSLDHLSLSGLLITILSSLLLTVVPKYLNRIS